MDFQNSIHIFKVVTGIYLKQTDVMVLLINTNYILFYSGLPSKLFKCSRFFIKF